MGANRLRRSEQIIQKQMKLERHKLEPKMQSKRKRWGNPTVRIKTVRKNIFDLDIEPRALARRDFDKTGNSGLRKYYNGKILPPLIEAGFAYTIDETKMQVKNREFNGDKIYPWEIRNLPIYKDKELRIGALLWLATKKAKEPREIIKKDFIKHGLGGLLSTQYKGQTYSALFEAELVEEEDEEYMRKREKFKFKKGAINPIKTQELPSLP